MHDAMKSFCRTLGIVLTVILLAGAAYWDLASGDETRQAGIAAETYLGGDWLIPRLNGVPFLEYPPLHAWCAAAAYGIFGINAFAAKLPSLLAAAGVLLLTVRLGKRMQFAPWQSGLSALFLLTGAQFFRESRLCRVDMLLTFFLLLAVTAFFEFTAAGSRKARCGWWSVFVLGLAGGMGAKGLIGGVLPAAVTGCWLVAADAAAKRFRWKRYAAALAGGIAACILIGVWFFLLWRRGGGAMLKVVLYDNNFGRFFHASADHAEPFWYYFVKLPELFQPWLVLLAAALVLLIRQSRKRRFSEGMLLLFAGALVPLLLLSASSAKRTVYLLSVFPYWALLCGAALPLLPERFRRRWTARRGIAALLVLTVAAVAVDGALAVRARRRDSLEPLFAAARAAEHAGKRVVLARPQERTLGAAVFYLHRRLPVTGSGAKRPPAGECWIRRVREPAEGGIPFNDGHELLFAPGEGL